MEMHTMQNLILVRHGESLLQQARPARYFRSDEERKILGNLPDHRVRLSELGQKQAGQAGQKLREIYPSVDVFYYSGYLRAKQTAQNLVDAYDKNQRLVETILLNERDTGYTHGMTEAEVANYFPYLSDYHERSGEFYFRFPGGESFADLCERVRVWLTQVSVSYKGKTVCAVAHWGTIVAIRYNLEGWDEDEFMRRIGIEIIANCSATCFCYDPNQFKLKFLGTKILAN